MDGRRNDIDESSELEETQGNYDDNQKDEGKEEAKKLKKVVKFAVVITISPTIDIETGEKTIEEEEDDEGEEEDTTHFRFYFPGQKEPTLTTAWRSWSRSAVNMDNLFRGDPNEGDDSGKEPSISPQDEDSDLKHIRSWKCEFETTVDVDWARRVNDDACMLFTVCDQAHPWKGVFSVDITSLLDGNRCIESVWGFLPGSATPEPYASPPPFLPESCRGIKLTICCEEEPLSLELARLLNPLSLEVHGARPLPGLIVEDDNQKMQTYVTDPITKEKDVFLLQKKYCQPVYAWVELFPGILGRKRFVRSMPTQQGHKKVKFALKTTILLGELDSDQVAESLESERAKVHIHDRDVALITTDQSLQKLKENLQAQYDSFFQSQQKALEEEARKAEAAAAAAKSKDKKKGTSGSTPREDQPEQDSEKETLEMEKSKEPQWTLQDMDRMAWETYMDLLERHALQQAHGTAVVSLEDLWNSSRELMHRLKRDLHGETFAGFSPSNKAADLKIRAPVVPIKRDIPVGGQVEKAELDLNDMELLVRQPGRYFDAGTEVRVAASLTMPIHHHHLSLAAQRFKLLGNGKDEKVETSAGTALQVRNPLFERVIIMMEYKNRELMLKVRDALEKINEAAVPHAESLRSYQLTKEEVELANNGGLDILTGFQVVDDEFRIIVVEGISGRGIQTFLGSLPRFRNTEQARILSNPEVRYMSRLYTPFEVDLKVIRLRDPLRYILLAPEIYDAFKVEESCRQALLLLSTLRSMYRCTTLARTQAFPSVEMLSKLESKYGESVSIEDLNGIPKQVRQKRRNNSRQEGKCLGDSSEPHLRSNQSEGNLTTTSSKSKREPLKGPTESHNEAFLKAIAARTTKDFLLEHREQRQRVKRGHKERMSRRKEADEELLRTYGGPNMEAYTYSGQKLNFVEKQQDALRKRLAKHVNVTYTYSKEFQSLGFSLVNEEQVARDEARRNRAKYITKRGFIYPAPRSLEEDRRRGLEISQARKEDLESPWEERRIHPRNLTEGNFDCIPTNEYALFGGYHQDGTRNKDFFRSVHIGGDGVELAKKEAAKRAKEEWQSKVIVDNVNFQPHQGTQGEKPCQLDKIGDILDGKPHKRGLRIVRNSRLPSGKPVPLRPSPVSIFLRKSHP